MLETRDLVLWRSAIPNLGRQGERPSSNTRRRTKRCLYLVPCLIFNLPSAINVNQMTTRLTQLLTFPASLLGLNSANVQQANSSLETVTIPLLAMLSCCFGNFNFRSLLYRVLLPPGRERGVKRIQCEPRLLELSPRIIVLFQS